MPNFSNSFSLLIVDCHPMVKQERSELFEMAYPGVPVRVKQVAYYQDAWPHLADADGVITDLFLPFRAGPGERLGLHGPSVVKECLRLGKPVAAITCGSDRPDARMLVEARRLLYCQGVSLFGSSYLSGGEGLNFPLLERKPWREAYLALLYVALGLSQGLFSISLPEGLRACASPQPEEGGDNGRSEPSLAASHPSHHCLGHLPLWAFLFSGACPFPASVDDALSQDLHRLLYP